MAKCFILVDGSSFLYRAFHALPALANSKGQPTGAIYGVVNMLRRLLADYEPDYVAVIFDAKGKTFRSDLYPEYKAQRPPMPEELVSQIEPLHAIVRAMGLPLLQVTGVEADDVIGTLSRQAEAAGLDTLMATNDKDMAQLVSPRIRMLNAMNGGLMDIAGVEAKFGVSPEQIIDYLSLMGDTVDNVPGVPKVGPKTAAKWLQSWGSLDAVIANAGEIPGKVGESLRETLNQLPLSRELVTIKCDVPLDLAPLECVRQAADLAVLRQRYAELEFNTWLADLPEDDGELPEPIAEPLEVDYEVVLDGPALERWILRLQDAEYFAFDTETTGLDYMSAEIVGLSFSVADGEAAYVPLAHDYPGAPVQLDRDIVLERMRPLLEDPAVAKVGQNLKYDMSVLARYGIELRGIRHDSMLESYVLDSIATRHNMDALALKYLSHATIHFEDIAGKGKKQLGFNEIDLEIAAPYAAEDADVTGRLHRHLWPRLQQTASLQNLYEELEIPLIPVLSCIERTGVMVDADALREQSAALSRRILAFEEQAFELAGQRFNLGSPKQIQGVLYEGMGLPVLSRTPKGQPSTAESVLQQLAEDFPLPKLILEHRSLSKLKSTYTDALPARIHPLTGRVHTNYHQAVTATGRLSSSEPNLQNIPIRTAEGRQIRQAFIAPPGYRLLAADYSQIELRIMAHLSKDPGLCTAFAAGADIHRATAAEVFAIPSEAVSTEQRRRAKAINFGLIYGMSAFGLARQLDIERREAQAYIDLYFARYPGVQDFMDRTREAAREQGYVETLYGRRLYLPEIRARNAQRRQYAERTAINAPMQGTAADIIKRAMIGLDHWLAEGAIDARMIMQVHDELVFEVAEGDLERARKSIASRMEAAGDLSVPLLVDVGTGVNWDEAH